MITIKQLDAKLSELQSMIAKFKAQQKEEPCPLEEGKFVDVELTPAAVKKWFEDIGIKFDDCLFARIVVESDSTAPDGIGGMAIHIGFTEDDALEYARSLIKACGGKSD